MTSRKGLTKGVMSKELTRRKGLFRLACWGNCGWRQRAGSRRRMGGSDMQEEAGSLWALDAIHGKKVRHNSAGDQESLKG